MTLPFVVVEAGAAVVDDARAELTSLGWRVVEVPTEVAPTPTGEGGVVWSLVVDGADAAARAVLAAVAGTGLLVDARAEQAVCDRLCEDLRRLGHLDHRIGDAGPLLSLEERAVVDLLSDGLTLGETAQRLHISRRTADRRLAAARVTLGAETTAEAIAIHRRRLDRLPRPR